MLLGSYTHARQPLQVTCRPAPSPTSIDAEKAEMEDPLEAYKICHQVISFVEA